MLEACSGQMSGRDYYYTVILLPYHTHMAKMYQAQLFSLCKFRVHIGVLFVYLAVTKPIVHRLEKG